MAAPCVIGVDLGGTKLVAGAIDEDLAIRHWTRREVGRLDQAALLDASVEAVSEVSSAVGGDVAAVGFGIPCTIDRATGVAVQAVNLDLRDVPFQAIMSERLALPVVVDNDANCAVLLEARHGAGRGAPNVVMLTLGTGIGGGMVLDGRLFRGSQGAAGELGHMVVDMDGLPCQRNCPSRGCLESVASGTALAREGRDAAARHPDSALARAAASGAEVTGALVTELAHSGDAAALEAVEAIGSALGVGLVNIANVFNPDVTVIGGGVIGAGELLLEPARRVLAQRALLPGKQHMAVRAAAFGPDAGMLGAAVLAREECLAGAGA